MPVICTGSIAYDYLMTFPGFFRDHILPDRLESISLSFLVDTLTRQRGGTAPNIAFTMALLDQLPLIAGTVGEDFGDYRAWLEGHGLDTRFIRVIPDKFTASFFANTDQANNQICSFYTGAMAHAGEISLHEMVDLHPELVIISPNDPAAMDQYVSECIQLGLHYLYDPGQQVARVSGSELRRGVENAYSLFCNEYEFELLQKHTGLSREDILKTVHLVVVTLGKNGADIFADGVCTHTPVVPPEEIADPTGVGDAFRGGFVSGWLSGLDWITCGQMGALAATYCLEQRGTQNHTYTPAEFVARYRRHFDDQGKLDNLGNRK
jgi:adenosine kinase